MALNQAHWNGGVLIHAGEWIILFCDGVELALEGGDEPAMKGRKKGRLYLTSHRVIFTTKDAKESLQSFAMPFSNLGAVDIDQPVFGANAIKGNIKALPGGNWTGAAQFRLTFSHGGAIEFGQAMIQAAKLASRNAPPPYTPAYTPQSNGAGFYQPAPQQYMSQQHDINGFVPPKDKFPSAPPAQDVWMTDQPPPYSSIYPQLQNPVQPAGYAGAPGYPAQGPPSYPQGGVSYPPTSYAAYPPQATYQGYPPAGAVNGSYPAGYAAAPNGSYPTAPPAYQEKEKR